jgi:hypothetical protein
MYTSSHNSKTDDSSSIEPADPDSVDHKSRYGVSLANGVSLIDGKQVYTECGCERCPERVDPLSDADIAEPANYTAFEQCESPKVVDIGRARKINLTYQQASRRADRTSKYERHRYQLYPRLLEADRHFRQKYDGLTTVMLTRRLRPVDKNGEWFTPMILDRLLHNGTVMSRIRECLGYHICEYDFEYVRVTATTKSAATPHEHRFIWIDDPGDEITVEDVSPALNKHLNYIPCAHERHHELDPAGDDGPIRIQHDPSLVDEVPEKAESVKLNCQERYDSDGRIRNTRGAQYIASQLAHLPLGDKWDADKDDPQDTLLEGSAIAWASPNRWFGASHGVPSLQD